MVDLVFMLNKVLLIAALLYPGLQAWAEPTHPVDTDSLKIPYLLSHDVNHEDYYFYELLRLALAPKGSEAVALEPQQQWVRDQRLRLALQQGDIDILWSQTSIEFERQMLAVKVPLLKGLSQYRLLLIRAGEQSRFNPIKSLKDLAQLRGGMGSQWPDVALMEANGLQLVTATGYGKLFRMLAEKKFDYFSRGIYQIQSEVHFYPTLPLAIEQRLLLRQRGAMYFFVASGRVELAKQIEQGLQVAQRDGSFDRLFNSVPRYRWAMSELERGGRRILELRSK